MSDRGSAWDGQHNGRPAQEPGQRYLRGASTVCFCDSIQHFAGNLASSQWEPGNKGDFIALAIVHYVVPFAVGKAVTVLHGNDGNNFACALDMFLRDVGQRDQANLAFVSQPSQSFNGRFKRNDRIRTVQLINVDVVQAQSFETSFNRFLKVRGSRIMGPLIRTGPVPASFGRNHKTSRIFRRVGKNELSAIDACRELVEAQKQYFARPPHDIVKQFAQRFVSDEGRHDGLYWHGADDESSSPINPLIAYAFGKGAKDEVDEQVPFNGYFSRILTSQGSHAPGGAKNYVVDGKMSAGFAFVAYPAEYRSSGVMTFIVDGSGTIYEKDLGPDTTRLAEAMTAYDPDSTWHKAE
jgi:hypothetical protein